MQTVQDREAARLHDGLKDAFRSLFQACMGRSLGPGLGFVIGESHLGLTQDGRLPGMVTTPDEFVPAVAPSGPRLEIDRAEPELTEVELVGGLGGGAAACAPPQSEQWL